MKKIVEIKDGLAKAQADAHLQMVENDYQGFDYKIANSGGSRCASWRSRKDWASWTAENRRRTECHSILRSLTRPHLLRRSAAGELFRK